MASEHERSNFNGSWAFVRSENYEAFVEAMYKDASPDTPRRLTTPTKTLNIAVDGDTFTIQGDTVKHSMEVGKPKLDQNHWVQETRVPRWEGRSLVIGNPSGGAWTTVTEVVDDDKLNIKYIAAGGLQATSFYKRVADQPKFD